MGIKQTFSLTEEEKEKLIEEYMPLVKKLVSSFIQKVPPNVDFRDLINAGIFGLIEAAEKYDESLSPNFEVYAYHRIRGSILDFLRSSDWLPRSLRAKIHRIEKAYHLIEQKLGRSASEFEVAKELNVPVEEFQEMLSEVSNFVFTSFEELGFGTGEERFKTELNDESAPLSKVLNRELVEIISRALERLPEKEKLVTVLYFYEELNLKEIAEILNITESRVSQLRTSALIRLKVYLRKFLDKPID
jgi:RNA polymerase sigma factor FliA